MTAYRLLGSGQDGRFTREDDVPRPPRHDEVLLRVHASALNFRDVALLQGWYPLPRQDGLIQLTDAAAEVLETGSEVGRFVTGDRVCSTFFPGWFGGSFPASSASRQYGTQLDGWMCQYKTVRAEDLVHLPAHLSYREGATLPCAALTAWNALHGRYPVGPGDVVQTQGTGGVALFALQFARMLGASVIATTSGDAKAALLHQLGATHVINYRSTPDWGLAARELTGGVGVNRIVEIGGPGTLAQSLQAVANEGEIALVGFVAPGQPQVDFMQLFMSGAVVRRINVGNRLEFECMNAAISQHGLHPVLDQDFALDDHALAFERLMSGGHSGKVTLRH